MSVLWAVYNVLFPVGFLALLLYALCYVSGSADLERETYLAGWEAAMAKREEEG
ncbi:MAG: hypothetical protein BWY59_01786 [Verrucomicrobia bacterium ADurb.Bin345]|nr:MAG: hypothetical protein BWY59_01786 [Verrucomicrobia bacterium ADurb.Bin345]